MSRRGLLLAVVLLSTGPARGEASTLEEAVAAAVRGNRELAVRRAEVERAAAELRAARLLLPEDGELSIESRTDAPYADEGARSEEIVVTQALPRFGRGARVDAARARHRAAELELDQATLDVVRDVRVAYVELLAAERGIDLSRQTVEINDHLSVAAAAKFEAGDISQLELDLATLDAENSRAALGAAELARTRARVALGLLVGDPRRELSVAPFDAVPPAAVDADAEVARALEQRPDLGSRRQRVLAADSERRAARWGYAPDAALALGLERERSVTPGPNDLVAEEERVAVLELSLRLPTSGHAGAHLALTSTELAVAERERDALASAIEGEVRTAAAALAQAARTVSALEALLPRVESNLQTLRSAYEEGQISLADYLLQRDRAIQVRRSIVDGRLALGVAIAELDRAVGRPLSPR